MRASVFRSGFATLTIGALVLLTIGGFRLASYKRAILASEQGFTFYPPSVYMRVFPGCVADSPCVTSESFEVRSVPTGCCVLILTNGDGASHDEVGSYEVFLNEKRVIPEGRSRNAQ